MLIPEYQTHYDTVASLITAFCDQHLDTDYKAICFHALDKLSRKRPFPFLTGRDQMWAAGIVYAIAQNCYLIGNQYIPLSEDHTKRSPPLPAELDRRDHGLLDILSGKACGQGGFTSGFRTPVGGGAIHTTR